MKVREMVIVGGLLVGGILSGAVLFHRGDALGDSGPNGVWTLVETVEDDGTTEPQTSCFVNTYTVDTVAHTIVNRWYWPTESSPFRTKVFQYEETPEGHWFIEDAGPDGRSITFAVESSESSLTLTRVWYDGPNQPAAPAPAYPEGSPPPPPPSTAVPPPMRFILTR